MRLKLTPGKIADQLNVSVSHISANDDATYCYSGKGAYIDILKRLKVLNTFATQASVLEVGTTQDGLNFVRFCLVVEE